MDSYVPMGSDLYYGNMSQSPKSATNLHPTSELEEGTAPARLEVRVAVIGNVDSGKSTLVGVLTKGAADDGRGLARSYVFNYQHEQANGRTSSIAHEIMGFRASGEQVLPERLTEAKNISWVHIVEESQKIVTFLDLCGHERYLKTTLFGLVGLLPDYALVLIGANMGVTRMTKEHLGLSLAIKIPIIVVITKTDLAPNEVYSNTLATVQKILKSPGAGRLPFVVRDENDMTQVAAAMDGNVTPVFSVSNVTGQGIAQLKELLRILSPRSKRSGLCGQPGDSVEFLIDGVYNVVGVGTVVGGVLQSGTVSLNQVLQLGPDGNGDFRPVVVKGIHFNRMAVETTQTGQSYCFALKTQGRGEPLKRNSFRKGMVLVDKCEKPKAIWEFDAEVVILHHATLIRPNYQAVVHIGVVRQAAKVISMTKEEMSTGDKGLIRFRFMYSPEIIHPGAVLLFREGRTKGMGTVTSVEQTQGEAEPK